MRYQISGMHIDIGQALQTHVKNELGDAVVKYAERPTDANIVFSKSGHEYVCETTIHLSTGLTAQAKASNPEIYSAFDSCCEKMEKQLRRYKRRLKDHHPQMMQTRIRSPIHCNPLLSLKWKRKFLPYQLVKRLCSLNYQVLRF